MEQGLVFWDKYFRYQQEVTWDEFAEAFTKLLLDYGKIHLDEDQLLFIKSMVDPDYRNIVKVAHFLIFQDTYWKIQSRKQQLFKHQFKKAVFDIPSQLMEGLQLQILSIAKGYPKGERDLLLTRTKLIKTSYPSSQIDEEPQSSPYVQSIYIVQTPQEEIELKQEEVTLIGSGEKCDFIIKDDIQMNPQHLKLVWTPYNLFLMKDIAKSFRTSLRLQPGQYYLLDYQNVYKLGPETSFHVKQIQPLPKFNEEMLNQNIRYLESAQEHPENYFPFLMRQLQKHMFRSVAEYRHAVDLKELDTPNSQISKSFVKTQTQPVQSLQASLVSQPLSKSIIQPDTPTCLLEFISGPYKGQTANLDASKEAEYLIGKQKGCGITIPDQFIQNEHARIIYNQDFGWIIEHLDKKDAEQAIDPTIFGTFLLLPNKTQLDLALPSKAHVLQEGMVLNVGPYLLEAKYKATL